MKKLPSIESGRAHEARTGVLQMSTNRGLGLGPLAALLCLAGLAVASATAAKTSSGVMAVDSIAWAVSEFNQSTTSQDWTEIPDMSVTLSNKKQTDLVIDFCAETVTAPGEILLVRVQVDGVAFAIPDGAGGGGVVYTFDATSFNAVQCMTWAYKSLPVGTHTVTMEWRSWNGAEVFAAWRSMKVFFNSHGQN